MDNAFLHKKDSASGGSDSTRQPYDAGRERLHVLGYQSKFSLNASFRLGAVTPQREPRTGVPGADPTIRIVLLGNEDTAERVAFDHAAEF